MCAASWVIHTCMQVWENVPVQNEGLVVKVHEAITKISGDLGAPEVLCYNVGPSIGSWPPPLVEDVDIDKFRQGLEAGAVGAFIWCKEVIPLQTPVFLLFREILQNITIY